MDIGLYRGWSWYCRMAFYFLAGGCCSVVVSKTYRKVFLGDGMRYCQNEH